MMKKKSQLISVFFGVAVPMAIGIGCLTSCADDKFVLTDGTTNDWGLSGKVGKIVHPFHAKFDNKLTKNVDWSVISNDTEDFYCSDGYLIWKDTIVEGTYTVQIKGTYNPDPHFIATSGTITINIRSDIPIPPIAVVPSNPDPQNWQTGTTGEDNWDKNYNETDPTKCSPLDNFKYKSLQNNELQITGFSDSYAGETIGGNKVWVIAPCSSYTIDGVDRKVTTLGGDTIWPNQTFGNLGKVGSGDIIDIITPSTVESFTTKVFSNDVSPKAFIDISRSLNLTCAQEYTDIAAIGYWFMGLHIEAFITPSGEKYNTNLVYFPDDCFEYCTIDCDIDLRNYVKLTELELWSFASMYMSHQNDSGIYGYGNLILPANVDTLFGANFTASDFNNIYWLGAEANKISVDEWYEDIGLNLFFHVFSSTVVKEKFHILKGHNKDDMKKLIDKYSGYAFPLSTKYTDIKVIDDDIQL